MPLIPGVRLGPYEVIAQLGVGGMGEVWRATDTNLKRHVAIKVLPESVATDRERLARFQREAEVLAALNHPNIAHIYTVEELGDSPALVMELVEGPTLADRIARGPMTIDEALPIASQIASALDTAHEHGIVHRDLKPANVKVRHDGTVKVLDFGLAKALSPDNGVTASLVTKSPTMTSPAYLSYRKGETGTAFGVILGTAAYMSPEQARGEPVDRRTDIWAFGVLLYEMLTGRRLFQAATVTDTIAAIIRDTPQLDVLPARVRPLVRRCLVKDPKQRLRDIGDAIPYIDDVALATPPPVRPRTWPWRASTAVSAVMMAIAFWAPWRTLPAPESLRFQISPPEKSTFGIYMQWAPDGRRIGFTAQGPDGRTRIWIRDLASGASRAIPGTELDVGGAMAWSPDGRFLAFTDGLALKKIDVSGTTPPALLARSAYTMGSPTWGSAGVVLVGGVWGGAVQQVPDAGGDLRPATAPTAAELAHGLPRFLPDGRHFLYVRVGGPQPGIYVGSLARAPDDQPAERLVDSSSQAEYVPTSGDTGHIVFVRDGRLLAQAFDTESLTLSGDPRPLVEAVGGFGALGFFSTCRNGALAYRLGLGNQLTWFDLGGRALQNVGEPANVTHLRVSRDHTRLLSSLLAAGNFDIWVTDFERGVRTRATWDGANDNFPVWSPDGRRMVFRSVRRGVGDVYLKSLSGDGTEEPLLQNSKDKTPLDWSHDGRHVLYAEQDGGRNDLWVLPLDQSQPPFVWIRSPSEEWFGRFSPDSRWVAYESDQSGRPEVYVRPFMPVGASPFRVSTEGGTHPEWRADGKALYYVRGDRWLVVVDVLADSTFRTGPPRPLFPVPVSVTTDNMTMHPDGTRVLILSPTGDSGRLPIEVVTNWQPMIGQ